MPTNSVIHRSIDNFDRKQAFKKCSEALKKGGGLAIAQLNHVGFAVGDHTILGWEIDSY